MEAPVSGCACPGPGLGFPCGRPLDRYRSLSVKREAKYCPGCQIALCDRYIWRLGTGAPICPAVVHGPATPSGYEGSV